MRLIDADALHEKANGLNWKERSVIQHALRVSPTIEAEPVRHALWEEYPDWAHLRCTNCKMEFVKEKMPDMRKRCPNCGCKMDGDSHD